MHLTFSSHDVTNTTLTSDNGHAMFRVDTTGSALSGRTTTIHKTYTDKGGELRSEVVAQIDWQLLHGTTLRFNGNTVNAESFIQNSGLRRRDFSFTGPDGKVYKWHADLRSLQLDAFDGTTVATGSGGKRSLFGSHDGHLTINQAAYFMIDAIVMTFVYVEGTMERRKKAAVAAAAS
ncbi:hypothetical protein CONPUDRAFT_165564 [Coniophora puteana RWD-64-598 SS2]|uniref:DUF6593 domain-containing protein n=1 Tax=Coniophora puteana (strain RWD-64-598) TaxID=741705 RepID=A0A5M3MQG0_CONPW|nr:uncharacterized protein CONPUDRAFT_165564 [Coniophora puteana RWD-64-598 SS2]EIW81413.1 hypothetical protein CONPUDRAFT_165564 [Coniophora puteana RWD-64-598 SS2]